MLTWTERATLFKILAVLWTQHRWCLVLGKTSSIAFQKPSAPSPTARSGAISSPRCLMSMRSSRQLCALSRTPVWKPTSSFLPSGVAPISTSMHSAASSIRLQVDPVRPHIHVSPRREVALLPGVVIRLPFCRQPRDHRRRQVRRVLAQEGGEGFLEVASRHPTQVENRQQRIEALRPPRPLRQDRRSEADFVLGAHVAPVAYLGATDLDRPHPGLDCPIRPMAMAHDTVAAIRQFQILPHGDKGISFGDQHLSQHAAGAFTCKFAQRIVDGLTLTERKNSGISRHGVSLLSGRFWQA